MRLLLYGSYGGTVFQKRALTALSLIVAIASPAVGAKRPTARRPEVGSHLGGVGARTVPVRKSLGAARLEVRVSRPGAGRRRSVVPLDREARSVGRSRPHSSRQHVRHATDYLRRDLRRRVVVCRQYREGHEPTGVVRRAAQRHDRAWRVELQRRRGLEAAGRRAHRRPQAGGLVPRGRPDRPDDMACEGAADVVSQPSAIGCAHGRRR